MKKIALLFIAIFCTLNLFAASPVTMYKSKMADKELVLSLKKAIEKSGYTISDEKDLAVAFTKQFEQSDFDVYYNLTVYDVKTVHDIIKSTPNIGAFTPFTVLVYRKKGEDESHFGFANSLAVANSLSIKEKKVVKLFSKSQKKLETAIKSEVKDAKPVKFGYKVAPKPDKELLFTVEAKLKSESDAAKKREDIETSFESALDVEGFKISNITKLDSEFEKAKLDDAGFDFYETYSICKLKVIYNASKERPETGVFAPCSVFIYKKKGDNRIVVGFPPTKNWVVNTNITNKEHIKIMQDAEAVAMKALKEGVE